MLRIIVNSSAGRAKSYYTSPSTADYYTQGQELEGTWRGEGAARLGLAGKVDKDAWDALCDNRNPVNGQTLTLRRKDQRRVGYDFNFHAPKSLSVLYAYTKDERIMDAFKEAVDETMRDMELEMKTRVRTGGDNVDRTTGNMVSGEFVHLTARPVGGQPDPHLHAHCFVFNSTFDPVENRWKAGQFGDIKRDAAYFEACFHSRLTGNLGKLGLPVMRTRFGWEIGGIGSSILDKFSRRTSLIEEKAKERGITDAKEKAELGASTRERKQKDMTFDQLRSLWKGRMSAEEVASVEKASDRIGGKAREENPQEIREAVDLAVEHAFERKSVLPERQLWAAALKQSVGQASVDSVLREVKKRDLISGERENRRFVTTANVLAEEHAMLDFARDGRGTCLALAKAPHVFSRDWLNAGQRKAVEHVLGSRDRVVLIRGAAGVGKTSMMQEAVEGIEAGGTKVMTFAPSADASRGVLRSEGFADADTVARLLADKQMQENAKGKVWWIDEAGLLGTGTTARVFDLADKLDARVVLSGDRRQHGSVERGAALRLLETEAGLIPAEIKEIQRQKGGYKQAVEALSEGRTEDGFEQLDKLGWIKEIDSADRYKMLASEYVAAVNGGKSALVVSPTHLEGEAITDEIRSELRRSGKLGKEQRQFVVLQKSDLTVAQQRDPVNYANGDVLVYHQNAQGHRRGEKLVVDGETSLPLAQANRFQVYHANVLSLSAGDVVRITKNGFTTDEHRLNNGACFTVRGFSKNGDIELANGWTVSKDNPFLTYGYVVTSHASQGKTVDRVFIGSSSASSPAASREQFYVSVSRGREVAKVFTDDKEALKEAVGHTDERLSATEILGLREQRQRHAMIERQAETERREIVNHNKVREGRDHER
jgi:conjugative relaxase-like TrwC/TraI family protein